MDATPRHSNPYPAGDPAEGRAAAAGPAGDLGDVWQLLDVLPSGTASVDLAATTVDLVAAKVAGAARARDREPGGTGRWIMPLAIVATALAGGLVAGRATAPDPDRWVLEKLPLIEHLGLLREVGSIEFLEALAERIDGRQGPPRWLGVMRDPNALREETREFDAALVKLEADELAWQKGGEVIDRRRRQVAGLPADRRSELERAAETFRGLSSIDGREVAGVAAALADPTNRRLRDAARNWHLILAAMNPVFRRSMIEMPADERLEMLERTGGRPRDEFRDRRPPGDGGDNEPRRPAMGPPGPAQGGWPRPAIGPGRGGQRPPPGTVQDQPGFRFPPPPTSGSREAPGETPAPPR